MYTEGRSRATSLPQTFLVTYFLSSIFPTVISNILTDAYRLCHDLCLVLEMLREGITNTENVGTRTKTGKRVWWKEPGWWSQEESTSRLDGNLKLHSPSVKWTVGAVMGELRI